MQETAQKATVFQILVTAFLFLVFIIVEVRVIMALTGSLTAQESGQAESGQSDQIKVTKIKTSYKSVSEKPAGEFKNGQEADIMLSGIGFNKSGGPLLFNHPGNLASDGKNLILVDRNNNRVLIWKQAPSANTPPDLVLGQKDFNSNNPGTGLDELSWPVGAATDGRRLIVADTENDRILIWNSMPSENGQKADLEIKGAKPKPGNVTRVDVLWPWAVWTNGEKLVVAATGAQGVLIWNDFPTQNNQKADIILNLPKYFGTPRTIGSNGSNLVIGDHNAKLAGGKQGTYFWKTFPTENDQPPDFLRGEGTLLWGPSVTEEGRLIAISDQIHIWNSFPENETDEPDLSVGAKPNTEGYDFGGMNAGDGSSTVIAGGRLYVSLSNGNKIAGFKSIPQRADQKPDFAIGTPDINANTLLTNYFLTNPQLATDGQSLIAGSTFGGLRLYVWKKLPDEDGAKPDFYYDLTFPPNFIGIKDGKLIVEGDGIMAVWNKMPLDGEMPDEIKTQKADPWEFAGGGQYLAVKGNEGEIAIYKKGQDSPVKILGRSFLNLPEGALVSQNKLFVADTGFHRVLIWNNVEDAISGQIPDIVLGQDSLSGNEPRASKNGLFRPASLAFDGSYLWVGERKFSNRILRFSVGR